ncbi:MAG: DNA-binding protein [Thermoprotei archaeon]|nr:MAG: DNA-binding protein [Thermoprotei archaeon]
MEGRGPCVARGRPRVPSGRQRSNRDPTLRVGRFHRQQAAERAIKAALYVNHVEVRGHSVTALLDSSSRRNGLKLGEDLRRYARLLNRHYSPPRYPNLHPGIELLAHELYGEGDAQACLRTAESLLRFLEELLR